ncbi:MAG: FAD-dependent oxidoreductase [Candidatus Omnitrophica bacterium]|nr:FAD-dependent oxidoreductase [Candidatus Omnitrophota bacterium]
MTLVDLETDFFIAGGGMAGVCAALAAARNGIKVVLAQDRSRLGGNASSEVRMHIVGSDHSGARKGWREAGILEELRLENAAWNPHSAWELWDLLLYDKLISEPNVTLLLDSVLYAAEVEEGVIERVMVRCDKTENLYRIKAKQYADCTGDCRLAIETGAEFRWGHEARSEFNEPLAPEDPGPETLGSSILFTARDYGKPIPYKPPHWARKVTKDDLRFRSVKNWEYGYWWIEWGGEHDTIRDNERIRFELLSIVMGVWDYIKNSGDHPDSANWGMDWVGMIPGKRESRRVIGDHILTQSDLMGLNGDFEDAVAIGGWPFDNHPPSGFDNPEIPPYVSVKIAEVYNIPLRSLYSKDLKNLFIAGRNISTSHVAFTSTRVMGTCSVEGQAIGTAAAFCVKKDYNPRDLYEDKPCLKDYQQRLLRDDQTIKNLRNEDPDDLARKATVTASSEIEGSKAVSIIDGFVRDMPGEWNHRWGGSLESGEAWVDLSWEEPQEIGSIQITFDSGFSRPLTLTEQAGFRSKMVTDRQPETVKSYEILYRPKGSKNYSSMVKVEDNWQRLCRHRFDRVEAEAIRIRVTATNGNPEARIYEVRCYGA